MCTARRRGGRQPLWVGCGLRAFTRSNSPPLYLNCAVHAFGLAAGPGVLDLGRLGDRAIGTVEDQASQGYRNPIVSVDITPQEAMKRLEQHFGSREGMLKRSLIMLSISGQPTDVTFYRRKPILDVRVRYKAWRSAALWASGPHPELAETHRILQWKRCRPKRDMDNQSDAEGRL